MEVKFNTPNGETVARELQVAFLNVGEIASPDWAALGSRTTDSSAEYDWSRESSTDVLGKTRTSMKKPIITQTFDPLPLDGGDKAIKKLHQLAIVDQNPAALCNLDMLIVHYYTTVEGKDGSFAERYDGCSVEATGLGGEGGGNINMPITVTYGGNRTLGTATKGEAGAVTFTAEDESAMIYSAPSRAVTTAKENKE